MRQETERKRERAGSNGRAYPLAATGQRCYRNRPALALMVGAALMIAPAIASGKAAPCKAHPAEASPGKVNRATCMAAHKRQRARDRMQFPPNPTRRDVAKRVPDWQGFVRLGRCEQPGPSRYGDGVMWQHKGPTWGGGVGLYHRTWHAAGSPYRLWSGDKWETILVADAVRDRFGITAWGAWRCFG